MAKKQTKPQAGCPQVMQKKQPVAMPKEKTMKNPKTKIFVHCDCGFQNALYIRGEGISLLSWDKGQPLKNISKDQWVWECDRPFSIMQFKITMNDSKYESGPNHSVGFGQQIDVSPKF